MTTDLRESYRHCQQITRREARNFYFAFLTLPPAKRRAIYAAYAFCRLADDIADGGEPVDAKREQLQALRGSLHEALAGQPEGPIFTALGHAAQTYGIPQSLLEDVLDGAVMDLSQCAYETFEDLKVYCYRVASAVGLMSIYVLGYERPEARDYAVDLGLAMQLTNIIRDLREDIERGRVYLPQAEMRQFGYSNDDLRQGVIDDRYLALMRLQAERARRYFDSGARLFPLLSSRSRACPAVLHGLYSRLLDRIEASGFDVFGERVSLPTSEKLRLTAKLWATSVLPRW